MLNFKAMRKSFTEVRTFWKVLGEPTSLMANLREKALFLVGKTPGEKALRQEFAWQCSRPSKKASSSQP
jgi:hypothetical protein